MSRSFKEFPNFKLCKTRKHSESLIHLLLQVQKKNKKHFSHFFSSPCLMNVLMRHWQDLLHKSWVFSAALPTPTTTLLPLPSVKIFCELRRTSDAELRSLDLSAIRAVFFLFLLLSAGDDSLLGMQEGEKLHRCKLRALCVCQLCPVLSTLPFQQWRDFFFPFFSPLCVSSWSHVNRCH